MSSENIGIEDARKRLGDIVTAVQQGADVVLTRNGKPAARLVTAKGKSMPVSYLAHRPVDEIFAEIPPYAGSFNPHSARYWVGDGKPRPVELNGEIFDCEDREGERLWQADGERWIVTRWGNTPAYLITAAEAEQWFADNGYATDREVYARRLDA